MRIALVFPNYWPYVRRGAERLMVEYADLAVAAGHRVDIVTSKPGRARVVRRDGRTIHYASHLTHPVMSRHWIEFRFYSFTLTAVRHLLANSYDLVHIWLPTYGLAARLARRLRGTPYLYQNMGAVLGFPGPLGRLLVSHVIRPADRVATLTPRGAARATQMLGIPVEVLPPCVDVDAFAPRTRRDASRPRVFFASDPTDLRKGVTLLLMAWNEVHRRCPEAVLTFGGPYRQTDIPTEDPLGQLARFVPDPAVRRSIEVIGEGRPEDLPARYASSSVTVLPSLEEAFGLVLVESLASGTPVVTSAGDGPGEIVTDDSIGTTVTLREFGDLVDPARARELADALLRTIELSHDPRTAQSCRDHSRRWSRERVGPLLLRTYEELAARPRGAVRRTVGA